MEIDMILWFWYSALIAVSFGAGWLSRFVFVQCNKYRMLKRLVAFNAEFKEYHAAHPDNQQ